MGESVGDSAAGGQFRGAYSLGDALDARAHELTPERDTIEEVVTDLLEAQRQKRTFHFVQIIDTTTLRPIEPAKNTLARLRQLDGDRERTVSAARSQARSKARDRGSSPPSRSFGLLVLAMTVICVTTVAFVLLLP